MVLGFVRINSVDTSRSKSIDQHAVISTIRPAPSCCTPTYQLPTEHNHGQTDIFRANPRKPMPNPPALPQSLPAILRTCISSLQKNHHRLYRRRCRHVRSASDRYQMAVVQACADAGITEAQIDTAVALLTANGSAFGAPQVIDRDNPFSSVLRTHLVPVPTPSAWNAIFLAAAALDPMTV